MAEIHIDRSSEIFNGGTPYHIYIDDKKVGTIGNGEDKYFEVGQGEHTVAAKMNFFMGSTKVLVSVKGDEVKTLKTNGISGAIWMLVLGAACIGSIFYLSDIFPVISRYAYMIYPGLFVLYFLTIGRKKHISLTLEEKTKTDYSAGQSAVNHPKMAKIYIDRSSEFFNRHQPCQIYIDDEKVGTVDSGEEKYFEVGQGEHTVAAKMVIGGRGIIDIWVGGSPKVLVTVNDNETKKFKVSGLRGLLWFLGTILSGGLIAYILNSFIDVNRYFIIIYGCFFVLSFLTFGKKNYLTLTLEE